MLFPTSNGTRSPEMEPRPMFLGKQVKFNFRARPKLEIGMLLLSSVTGLICLWVECHLLVLFDIILWLCNVPLLVNWSWQKCVETHVSRSYGDYRLCRRSHWKQLFVYVRYTDRQTRVQFQREIDRIPVTNCTRDMVVWLVTLFIIVLCLATFCA